MGRFNSGEKLMTSELDPKIRIRAPLRCDGVGSLDCAEHVDSGMRMAVRWLPLEANGAAAARAVESLPEHPTLPKIRSTGRVGSAAFVAMDFPDGKLLGAALGELFGPDHVRRIGEEIADALATMHSQDVVHGELSADSILLTGERAILWDMPLVLANRLTDRRGEERMLSQLPRIAFYLAPERARGVPAMASSDVYALGAILSQLLGAKMPQAASTLALVHQVASGEFAVVAPESAPLPLRRLLERMLSVDPRSRPTAREAADRLRVAFETPAITAPEMPAVVLESAIQQIPVITSAPAVADDVALLPPPLPVKQEASVEVMPPPLPVRASAVDAAVVAELEDARAIDVPARETDANPDESEATAQEAAPREVTASLVSEAVIPTPVLAPAVESAVISPELRSAIAPTNPEAAPALRSLESSDEAELPKSRMPWLVMAGAAMVAIIILSALLLTRPRPTPVKPQEPVKVAVATTIPVKAMPKTIEDDLAPLVDDSADAVKPASAVLQPEALVAHPKKKAAKKQIVAKQAKAETSTVTEEAPKEPGTVSPTDFDFLPKDVAAPTSELKRPEM